MTVILLNALNTPAKILEIKELSQVCEYLVIDDILYIKTSDYPMMFRAITFNKFKIVDTVEKSDG